MTIKVFLDSADLRAMRSSSAAGFTTNPTLMRKAGVEHYRAFGRKALEIAGDRPVSLEVLSDDFNEMERQAREISSWGKNAYVKIPVVNSRGDPAALVLTHLAAAGVNLNVTAVFTEQQVREAGRALAAGRGGAIVSVFAGRIADAGVDPLQHVKKCRTALRRACPRAEMLWASTRQAYDRFLAEEAGCEIVTMTPDLFAKLGLAGRDLGEFSRATVEMFLRDAEAAGYAL